MSKKKPATEPAGDTAQSLSPSYRLAFYDDDFMMREELRPVRLQLELLKPELVQQDLHIHSTVVIFGGTRIKDEASASKSLVRAEQNLLANPEDPLLQRKLKIAHRVLDKSHFYESARKLAYTITHESQVDECGPCEMVVVTGGGPGMMEAANRGALEAGGKSIGLNIVLPHEQEPNAYITPELSFQFHYFALRKMHFLMRAKALVAFPGGFGTLDELFETLTLIQTGKIAPVPVLLFGRDYWERIIDFDAIVDEGTIDIEDLELFSFVDSPEDAWAQIKAFYAN